MLPLAGAGGGVVVLRPIICGVTAIIVFNLIALRVHGAAAPGGAATAIDGKYIRREKGCH